MSSKRSQPHAKHTANSHNFGSVWHRRCNQQKSEKCLKRSSNLSEKWLDKPETSVTQLIQLAKASSKQSEPLDTRVSFLSNGNDKNNSNISSSSTTTTTTRSSSSYFPESWLTWRFNICFSYFPFFPFYFPFLFLFAPSLFLPDSTEKHIMTCTEQNFRDRSSASQP